MNTRCYIFKIECALPTLLFIIDHLNAFLKVKNIVY